MTAFGMRLNAGSRLVDPWRIGPERIIQGMGERREGAPEGQLQIVGRPPGECHAAEILGAIGAAPNKREDLERIRRESRPLKEDRAMHIVIDHKPCPQGRGRGDDRQPAQNEWPEPMSQPASYEVSHSESGGCAGIQRNPQGSSRAGREAPSRATSVITCG